jgi:hypothetical protein
MTNEELQQLVLDLQEQVKELMEWKEARTNQQITQPIDTVSQAIIKKTFGI